MPSILHVMADGGLGGGAIHVLQLVRSLAGRFAFGLATEPDSFLADAAAREGTRVFGATFSQVRLEGARQLRVIVSEFRPDLVHVHGGRAAFAVAAAGIRARVLYTVHGYHFFHRGGARGLAGRAAERFATRRLRHVVFVSTHDARLAERYRFVPRNAERLVIHNSVRCEEGGRPARRRQTHVGFIGRLVPQKDPLLFVETVAQLPGYTATMIGDGELRMAVAAAIERHRLGDRMVMLGALDNARARAELRSFGALVMTSRWEPMGIVALEAFCAGVPVVATRVGGISDAVVNEETGLLAERTPEALAEAVQRLDADATLRGGIVANGRQRVLTEFSEERMLSSVEALYERLASTQAYGR